MSGPSAFAHRLFDAVAPRIGAMFRKRRWDVRRLDRSELTHRILEHDLPRLARSPTPVIFDVGANKGQTIELMSRLFPASTLYAFEPSETLARTLRDRYAPRGVMVEATALGAREEERQFFTYQNNELSSFLSLAKNPSNPFAGVGVSAVDAVRVKTIDDYCMARGIREIDILKIDTQGFDLEVLKGAARMLSAGAIGVLLIEINFIPLYDAQCTPGEMIDWLIAHDFHLLALYEQVRLRRTLSWVTACFVRT
jgi:FkbM family methyltransferase